MQHVAHAQDGGVGEHDEPRIAGRLVIVQFVLAGAEADEGVVVAAKLAHHVAQREDGSEDELGIVLAGIARRPSRAPRTTTAGGCSLRGRRALEPG